MGVIKEKDEYVASDVYNPYNLPQGTIFYMLSVTEINLE